MTAQETIKQAARELKRPDGIQKETRVAILRHVKNGERFDLTLTAYEVDRIGKELRRSAQGWRMHSEKLSDSTFYNVQFNQSK